MSYSFFHLPKSSIIDDDDVDGGGMREEEGIGMGERCLFGQVDVCVLTETSARDGCLQY